MSDEPQLMQGGVFAFLPVQSVFIITAKCYGVNATPLAGYFQWRAEVTVRI